MRYTDIALSIEEMLTAETIEGIGADHKDTGVAVVRILGYVRKLEEENAQLRASLGPALKDTERLAWLHRAGPHDAAGCEWGIFRVLWDGNGQPVAVSQTLSDFSDLDAEMQRNP